MFNLMIYTFFEARLFTSTFLTIEDFYESVLSGYFRGENLGCNSS